MITVRRTERDGRRLPVQISRGIIFLEYLLPDSQSALLFSDKIKHTEEHIYFPRFISSDNT